MLENELRLYFAGSDEPQLIETMFRRVDNDSLFVSIRGKTSGATRAAGSFQWTSAVKALAVLMLRSALAERDAAGKHIRYLAGRKASLASSLDYALSKQPCWLNEMFGVGNQGSAYARRLILRVNAERKRPGPVILGLNSNVLKPKNILVFWHEHLITSPDELSRLMSCVEGHDPHAEMSLDDTGLLALVS